MHSTQEAEGGLVSGVNRQVAYWQDGQGPYMKEGRTMVALGMMLRTRFSPSAYT